MKSVQSCLHLTYLAFFSSFFYEIKNLYAFMYTVALRLIHVFHELLFFYFEKGSSSGAAYFSVRSMHFRNKISPELAVLNAQVHY